ncbi:MAG: HD domain-containing protein [Methylococcales bacterium]|nr:HD domain-containing protein [Methylococcales bacterium]
MNQFTDLQAAIDRPEIDHQHYLEVKHIVSQFEKLTDIGVALSSEHNTIQLLEKILVGAISLTNADGGTIYMVRDDRIEAEILHNTSLKSHATSKDGVKIMVPLFGEDGTPNLKNVVSYSYHKDITLNIEDAYNAEGFDFRGTKMFDEKNHYRSTSFLTVPLKNHQYETVGMLQLINAIDSETQKVIPFDAIAQRFCESLASQAATVLTRQQLIIDLEQMFESMIMLIAKALDEKSPYNGGHCRRVPELTTMIAEAAHETKEGYLKDFTLTDADRYELRIAGLLHDCGKITTPEAVVDKATKLETIFDRIHLLETRFEVLKRDAKIAMLKREIEALKTGNELPAAISEYGLKSNLDFLTEEFNFIKTCNTGGEFMSDDKVRRLKSLEEITWQLNGETLPLLSGNELYNLCIARGTLTEAERKIINNHVSVTISMLSAIKWPKHLLRVTEYAGGHHERMDGKGYPKGLTREEMPIQARAMAIADVFEALTASDRPYKQGKKLSEALFILGKMKEEGHIDPDLYDAFIAHDIPRKYAEKFLTSEQVDI